MKRKLVGYISILCILVLGLTFLKGVTSYNSYFSVGKLRVLKECIDDTYLYDIDELALQEGIYSGYLTGLENEDTYYLTASEMKALDDEIEDLEVHPLKDGVYIKLKAIQQGTSEKLEQALIQQEGLILDLRNLDTDNIEEVQKICNLFLEKETIFKLETKEKGMQTYETTEGSNPLPIVLIINQDTKSGSEALVLALAERAISVGNMTGGDPYIKKIIPLEDGTGVSVAYGKLYDQYGRALSAIMPDEEVILSKEQILKLLKQDTITLMQDPFMIVALQKFNEARIIDKN